MVCNTLFAVFIGYLISTSKDFQTVSEEEKEARFNEFLDLEVSSWIADSVSTFILICSATYTICKLRRVFGSDFNREANKMTCIMVIFCIAFAVKTAYQWGMFHLHTLNDHETVL